MILVPRRGDIAYAGFFYYHYHDDGLGLGVYTPRQGQYEYFCTTHGMAETKDERRKTKDEVEGSMMQVRSNAEHDSFSVA